MSIVKGGLLCATLAVAGIAQLVDFCRQFGNGLFEIEEIRVHYTLFGAIEGFDYSPG